MTKFQKENEIIADGLPGKETIAKLLGGTPGTPAGTTGTPETPGTPAKTKETPAKTTENIDLKKININTIAQEVFNMIKN